MRKEKFTKGPWIVNDYGAIIANGDTLAVRGVAIPHGWAEEETTANVNLISTAPEMYEMLKVLREEVEQPARKEIEQLLAKARGETK